MKTGLWESNTSVVLLGEAVEYCTLDGESPVAESITSLRSDPSSMGHVESLLLSFPLATKMFQFARLSLACPWIQQQFERLTYSGISGSMLIFNSPKHFVAYYALPRLWVPRYPP